MQLLKSFAVIFLAFVINHQCAPSSQQDRSATKPEQNTGLYQGDMILPPNSNTATGRGVAIRPAYQRWTGGVIPYEFASNISAANATFIVQQMRTMETLTSVNNTQCIQFRPKNATDPYFITIFNGSGCYGPVGSWGSYVGVRPVSLLHETYSTCMISGIVQHELTHVLGFYHEQSRPDRDSYVSIQWGNIDPSQAFNFDKYNDSDVDTLMTSYDYGSVMHYEWNAFAINDSAPTIIPTQNASAFIGQRFQLSPVDILEIQRYYNCVATPTTTRTTTTTTTITTKTTTSTSTTSTSSVTTSTQTTTSTSTTSTASKTTTTSATTQTTTSATTTTATTATTVTTTSTANTGVHITLQLHLKIAIIWFITILQFFKPFLQLIKD